MREAQNNMEKDPKEGVEQSRVEEWTKWNVAKVVAQLKDCHCPC